MLLKVIFIFLASMVLIALIGRGAFMPQPKKPASAGFFVSGTFRYCGMSTVKVRPMDSRSATVHCMAISR